MGRNSGDTQLIETAEGLQTKNYNGKNKTYSIEFVQEAWVIMWTCKGEIKDRKIFTWVPLIGSYGETAVQITGRLIIIFGFAIYVGSMFLEQISWFLVLLGFIVGFLVLIRGFSLTCNTEYVKATRCKKCHKNYAYEEREESDIKEVSNEYSYTVTITRHWKCKYCGYIDSSESPEEIKSYKGRREEDKEIKCEKCGEIEVSSECRDPDVKEEGALMSRVKTTTRYYRCKHCGHLNTTELELEIEFTSV
jgi:hypothetical protein